MALDGVWGDDNWLWQTTYSVYDYDRAFAILSEATQTDIDPIGITEKFDTAGYAYLGFNDKYTQAEFTYRWRLGLILGALRQEDVTENKNNTITFTYHPPKFLWNDGELESALPGWTKAWHIQSWQTNKNKSLTITIPKQTLLDFLIAQMKIVEQMRDEATKVLLSWPKTD